MLPEFEQKLLEGAAQTGIAIPPISHTLAAAAPISIKRIGGSVQISFTGILQRRSEVQTWVDLDPQPTSPVTIDIQGRSAFWRARLP